MAEAVHNRLLESLSPEYLSILSGAMVEVDLPLSKSLCEPLKVPKYAHFMTSGITSVVTLMKNGDGVEVGLVGSEGLVEAIYLLGPTPVPTTAFVQSAGTALRMLFEDLRKEFLRFEPLRAAILQCAQGQGLIVNQLAACNRLHDVEERMSRWLLMVSDRTGTDQFNLTQEFLADMIGTQRSTVTLVAGSLQRSGLIEYHRGKIHILDRERLERAACECYPVVRSIEEQLYS